MLMFNADELFERLGLTTRCEDCEHRNKDCGDVRCENGTWAQVCDVLDHMKLIDAVPVVRCKDCRYYQDNNGGYLYANCKWRKDETPDANDYCSCGEKKDDE